MDRVLEACGECKVREVRRGTISRGYPIGILSAAPYDGPVMVSYR